MANTLSIPVPNIATIIATYGATGIIRIQRATTRTGVFANLDTEPLVTGQTDYEVIDLTGTTHWYRYRFENAGGTVLSDWSNPWPGRLPLTRTLQQLRQELATEMRMYMNGTFTTVTSSSVSRDSSKISTLVTADTYRGGWVHSTSGATSGESTRVGNFAPSTGEYTFTPALTTTPTLNSTYDYYRYLSPQELTDAINDALAVLTYREQFVLTGQNNRLDFPLPYWLQSESDILGIEYTNNWGHVEGEEDNAIWLPFGSGYNFSGVGGERILRFGSPRTLNQVFRVWALKPFVASADERLVNETDTVFAPLDELMIGAQIAAYDALIRNAGPTASATHWERLQARLQNDWEVVKRRQHVWRSVPIRGRQGEIWVNT